MFLADVNVLLALAAFALTGDMTLATLDKAFRSVPNLDVVVLEK